MKKALENFSEKSGKGGRMDFTDREEDFAVLKQQRKTVDSEQKKKE